MGTHILDELELPPSLMCTCSFREAFQKTHNGQQWVSDNISRVYFSVFTCLGFLFVLKMSSYSFSFAKHLDSGAEYHTQITDKTLTSCTFLQSATPGHIVHFPSHLPHSNHKIEIITSAAKAKTAANGVKEELVLTEE